ncbi:MAG: 1,4-dihydroxy-2-naphthoate polyprenyltransferase [Chitinophagales bacterium]|nr:1,4-dihydroxy-2-naphthoate polyprenyltransferase [Chitinophagales bacterium]
MISNWIQSFRIRTLPLSLATIGMGSILALQSDSFEVIVFVFTLVTAVLLQILSNLSNDFGDYTHGADNEDRQGPERTVQSGKITPSAMRIAIGISALLSMVSGIYLLYIADLDLNSFFFILAAGVASILAAMTYTLGKKPYGYRGLGDIFVFLFFGWVGVLGTYYLQVKTFDWLMLLPSSTCGLFITAVLNINNMRDIDSDTIAGKRTIPVIIGIKAARIYHAILLTFGWVFYIIYAVIRFNAIEHWIFLFALPFFLLNLYGVFKRNRNRMDPLLKQMVIATLLFITLIMAGQLISMAI